MARDKDQEGRGSEDLAAKKDGADDEVSSGGETGSSGRFWSVAIIVLALAGIGLSIELLVIHLTVVDDPFHPFACRVSEEVDCNAVALSPQAVFLGVPVPVWGIMTYLVFLAMGALPMVKKSAPWSNATDYVPVLAAWSVIYSAYLAYVSAFVLETLCLYCAGLYAVNIALLIAGVFGARPLGGYVRRRLEDAAWLAATPAATGVIGVAGLIGIIGTMTLYVFSSRPEVIALAPGVNIDVSSDPAVGQPRAPVTIIEFSDFECPACRKMHNETMSKLVVEYKSAVRLIHKNYPLDSKCNSSMGSEMHPHACDAAMAAECAHSLGKFEEYSEMLWTADDLRPEALRKMAEEAGMDPAAFDQCMSGSEAKTALLLDIQDGDKVGVMATPTFIVNGYRFTGYQDLKWCEKLIGKFLSGEKPPPAGVPLGGDR